MVRKNLTRRGKSFLVYSRKKRKEFEASLENSWRCLEKELRREKGGRRRRKKTRKRDEGKRQKKNRSEYGGNLYVNCFVVQKLWVQTWVSSYLQDKGNCRLWLFPATPNAFRRKWGKNRLCNLQPMTQENGARVLVKAALKWCWSSFPDTSSKAHSPWREFRVLAVALLYLVGRS